MEVEEEITFSMVLKGPIHCRGRPNINLETIKNRECFFLHFHMFFSYLHKFSYLQKYPYVIFLIT